MINIIQEDTRIQLAEMVAGYARMNEDLFALSENVSEDDFKLIIKIININLKYMSQIMKLVNP